MCAAGLGLGLLCASGCKKEEPADAAVDVAVIKSINKVCPMCGMAVNAEVATADLGKSMVGFCSDGCAEKWAGKGFEEQQSLLGNALSDN
ncbi:MAG: hypothetical protein D8M59_07955 [Planctomycetes bacterium]|nr:hypothetical protein [Planctomycetota bacterium]